MVARDVVVVAFGRRREDVHHVRTCGLAHCFEPPPDTLVDALSEEAEERAVGDDLDSASWRSAVVRRI